MPLIYFQLKTFSLNPDPATLTKLQALPQTRAAPRRWKPTTNSGKPVTYWIYPIKPWEMLIRRNIWIFRESNLALVCLISSQRIVVSTSRAITRSAWSQESALGSNPNLSASASPACGPLPVTIVPAIINELHDNELKKSILLLLNVP